MARDSIRWWKIRCFLVMALSLLPSSQAHPNFWRKCDHPDSARGSHQEPVQDEGIEFELVTEDGNSAVTCFTPKKPYMLKIKFPEARKAMLTTSAGSLAVDPEVYNLLWGIDYCNETKTLLSPNGFPNRDFHQVQWSAPDSTEEVVFKVTSARGFMDSYRQNSYTIQRQESGEECSSDPNITNSAARKTLGLGALVGNFIGVLLLLFYCGIL